MPMPERLLPIPDKGGGAAGAGAEVEGCFAAMSDGAVAAFLTSGGLAVAAVTHTCCMGDGQKSCESRGSKGKETQSKGDSANLVRLVRTERW
jgi:hypothetical protein